MKTEKKSLEASISRGFMCKFSYISCENEYAKRINRELAENVMRTLEAKKEILLSEHGAFNAVLSPTTTYLDDSVISIKYDFLIFGKDGVIFHKCFGVNLLYDLELVLLPRFLKKGRGVDNFYLTASDGKLFCVPIEKNLEKNSVVKRQREIDAYTCGKPYEVTIKIPDYLTRDKLDNVRKKLKK